MCILSRYKMGAAGVKQAEPRLQPKRHRRESRKTVRQSLDEKLWEKMQEQAEVDDVIRESWHVTYLFRTSLWAACKFILDRAGFSPACIRSNCLMSTSLSLKGVPYSIAYCYEQAENLRIHEPKITVAVIESTDHPVAYWFEGISTTKHVSSLMAIPHHVSIACYHFLELYVELFFNASDQQWEC